MLSAPAQSRAKAQALYAEALRITAAQGIAEALPLYLEVLELDPSFVSLQVKVALHYLQRDETAKAFDALKKAMAANPDAPELKGVLALAYSIQKNYSEAIRLAQEVLRDHPEEINAYRVLFEAYTAQGRLNEAVAFVEKTVQQKSNNPLFWVNLARLYEQLLLEEKKATESEIARRLLPLYQKAEASGALTPEALVGAADVYLRLGQYELARDRLEKAYALSPDLPALREQLAELHVRLNNDDRAIVLLEEVLAKSPTRAELYLELGQLYERGHNISKAEFNYRQALNLAPDVIDGPMRLASIELQQGKTKEALATLSQTLTRRPDSIRLALAYGYALRIGSQPAEAIRILSAARDRAQTPPEKKWIDADFFIELSLCHQAVGETERAEALLREAAVNFPNEEKLPVALASILLEKRRTAEALALMNQAQEKFPNSPKLLYLTAVLQRIQKNYPAALALHKKLAANPATAATTLQDPHYWQELALAQLLGGQATEAEATLRSSMEKFPEDESMALALVQFHLHQKQFPAATQAVQNAQGRWPKSAAPWLMAGTVARTEKNWPQARQAFAKARQLAIAQNNTMQEIQAYGEEAAMLEEAGQNETLEAFLREALVKFPESDVLLNSLAYFFAQQGKNLEEALRLSQKTLERSPHSGAYLDTLGWIYYKQGKLEQALVWLQEALVQLDDDPVVLEHLATVHDARSEFSQATVYWQQAVAQTPDDARLLAGLKSAQANLEKQNARVQATPPRPSF